MLTIDNDNWDVRILWHIFVYIIILRIFTSISLLSQFCIHNLEHFLLYHSYIDYHGHDLLLNYAVMSLFWWECLCCKEIKSVEITTNYINIFLTKIFFGLDKILCLKVFQSSYLHQTTNSQTTRSTVCCSTAHQSSRLSSCLEKLVGLSGLFFFGIRKIFLCFEPTWKSLIFKQTPKLMVCVVIASCVIL